MSWESAPPGPHNGCFANDLCVRQTLNVPAYAVWAAAVRAVGVMPNVAPSTIIDAMRARWPQGPRQAISEFEGTRGAYGSTPVGLIAYLPEVSEDFAVWVANRLMSGVVEQTYQLPIWMLPVTSWNRGRGWDGYWGRGHGGGRHPGGGWRPPPGGGGRPRGGGGGPRRP